MDIILKFAVLASLLLSTALFFALTGTPDSASACFPVYGIDHNGNDDPFTIFLGLC